MKNNYPLEQPDRFGGGLRHYHRAVTKKQPSWDDWADADLAKTRNSRNWPKFLGICFFVLILSGMIVGLMVLPG